MRFLLDSFLYDPKGAERVEVKAPAPWRPSSQQTRRGWLVKDRAGDRVYFTDGEWVRAPPAGEMTRIDFVARCRELYAGQPAPIAPAFIREGQPAGHGGEEPTLVLAAWLYRLGKKNLAAQVLAHAPEDRKEEVATLRQWLAQATMNRVVAAYGHYEDQTALAHGDRLLRLYGAEATKLEQAGPLVADLLRRKAQGVLGEKGPQGLPKPYPGWGRERQIAFLVSSLDGVQEHFSRRRDSAHSPLPPSVAALVKIGEAAVPALLEVLEKDARMTRAVQGPSKWRHLAGVQTVRDVALAVLSRILRVRQFDPRDPEADEYGGSPRDPRRAAAVLRAYWKEFGPLPFEARMMRVLADPKANFPALREAAANPAGELEPDESHWPTDVRIRKPSPAILKFASPTVAEAILSAMDRDLANDDKLPRDSRDHNRAYHEPVYFAALIRLGDRRIAPVLALRAEAEKDALMRLRLAHASYRLGQPYGLRTFAKKFGVGFVTLADQADGRPSRRQLEHIIQHFASVRLPEADRALLLLARPAHRYHRAAVDGLAERVEVYDSAGSFLDHPYCVPILRELLDDSGATGVRVSLSEASGGVQRSGRGYSGWRQMPAVLATAKQRKAAATLRRCDLAGELCSQVAGLPAFHPLLADADEPLAAMRGLLDQFRGKYRTLSRAEKEVLAGNLYEVSFGPDIPPLGRPATAEDVKTGRAVFHLAGKGQVADVGLPARGTFRPAGKGQAPQYCLIVQAERDASGELFYGVIERHAVRKIPARAIGEVTPLKRLTLKL